MPTKIRVLLVEDDEMTRTASGIGLELLGFYVGYAENGQVALDQLAKYTYDVIVLDLAMPVMSGVEFMKAYEGSAPIIVMSAWADSTPLPKPAFALVLKPESMREVASIIRDAVASKKP